MINKNLMKKIAPVVMSAAVVMSNMPYAVLASDFTDTEVITDRMNLLQKKNQMNLPRKMQRKMLFQQKHRRVKRMSL